MFYVIVNANSIVQQVIQIKNGINVNANVKSILGAKQILFGILVHVFERIVGT